MAHAPVRALAARQGREANPGTREEPGKIGHESRPSPPQSFLDAGWPDRGTFRYYGSADGTSWFCVVLAATRDERLAQELEAAWRAAGGWIARTLDSGGGLLRHSPGSFPGGLSQQGWRDTIDPTHPSGGRLARRRYPPAAAARRPGYASRDRIGAAGLGRAVGRRRLAPASAGAQGATVQGLRSRRGRAGHTPTVAARSGHSTRGWAGGLRAVGPAAEAERVRAGVLSAVDRLGHAPELYAVTPEGKSSP